MPIAAITFEFDPVVRLGSLAVPWETLGIAAVVALAILATAVLAARTPPDALGRRLHLDDLLWIAVGVVPGAIVGGRLGYALIHLDYYASGPGALLDPGQGGFELALAVAGGILTGAYVAWTLGAPIGRWAHVAAIPMLLLIEGGKAAMAWGGSGQGALADVSWATRYLGPGPWGSLAPQLPAQPSQLYEAGVALAAGVLLVVVVAAGAFRRRDGRLLMVALMLWLAGRVLVATTWRDPLVLGPLSADQLLSLALIGIAVVGALSIPLLGPRARESAAPPAWPEPTVAGTWRGPTPD